MKQIAWLLRMPLAVRLGAFFGFCGSEPAFALPERNRNMVCAEAAREREIAECSLKAPARLKPGDRVHISGTKETVHASAALFAQAQARSSGLDHGCATVNRAQASVGVTMGG